MASKLSLNYTAPIGKKKTTAQKIKDAIGNVKAGQTSLAAVSKANPTGAVGYSSVPTPKVMSPSGSLSGPMSSPSSASPINPGGLRGGSSNTYIKPRSSGSSGGSSSSSIGSQLSALAGGLSSSLSSTQQGAGAAAAFAPPTTQYRGNTGTTSSTFQMPNASAFGMSLEGQARQRQAADTQAASAQQRQANQAVITQAEQQKTNLSGQIAAVQSQLQQLQEQATTQIEASTPEEASGLDLEFKTQIEALERQRRQLENDLESVDLSPELQAAQQQEEQLRAQELQIENELQAKQNELRGQPVLQNFLSGQALAADRKADELLAPVRANKQINQMALARLQAQRKAAIDTVNSKLSRVYGQIDDTKNRVYDRREKREDEDRKANTPEYFNLGEGQSRYEYDPLTGTTKQIAARGKTYKPGSNSSNSAGQSTGDRQTLSQGGLLQSQTEVQNFFLNTPPEFQKAWSRNYAGGQNRNPSIQNIMKSYDDWVALQQRLKSKGGSNLSLDGASYF